MHLQFILPITVSHLPNANGVSVESLGCESLYSLLHLLLRTFEHRLYLEEEVAKCFSTLREVFVSAKRSKSVVDNK
jgi:hypothetical protein